MDVLSWRDGNILYICTQQKTRCTRGVHVVFSRARMRSSNSARMYKSTLLLRKSCSAHMTVFEIVFHRNVELDTIIDMMYLVDQSKPCVQIYLPKKCMLHKFAITLPLFVNSIIPDMHHRITYIYINFFANSD